MTIARIIFIIILTGHFLLISCVSNEQEATKNNTSDQPEEIAEQKTEELNAEFLGNYHGVQPGYNMKNEYGDDMIVGGNKISVPSIDYKFLLKENNIIRLQQTNLEDNSRVYYNGSIKIIENITDVIKLECSLSDGKSSSPTYIIVINKYDKNVNCIGNNEPEFNLKKIN